MREIIFDVIEPRSRANKYANLYDAFMICVIIISFFPLFFKEDTLVLQMIDIGSSIVFSIDYILRWITADFKLGKKGAVSFIRYPFTMMAIVDLLSILPGLTEVNPVMRVFRVVRLLKALRLIVVLKFFRYSRNVDVIINVFKKQKQALLMVLVLVVGYIIISATVIFQVEPDTFDNFFDALYWATISIVTVGYGDIHAVSVAGKLITMLSVLMGVAVIALPAGIITAGYIEEFERHDDDDDE